ncbi:predicted protein [Histoplasma mississippiense (nom. inval.)]|uniref:predicted protein n=1 Tax=Ajellomyces capsulatus (strain NAm1 / WU24) TaxID=2059318 RepID=UPI000157C2A8|nr:predicted protein [Histoplasma mississippiense (nom. inval.)]EDN07642.1 predicted protein [Histoplasma mississippiense (nom. inval.)]
MHGHTSLPHCSEGTIYEVSRFNDSLTIEINPTKIKFIKMLKTSEMSSIFHVNYDGMPHILKVFHNNEDAGECGWIEIETRQVESVEVKLADDQKQGLPLNTKYY